MSDTKPTTAEAIEYLRAYHNPRDPCGCRSCRRSRENHDFILEQLQRVDALEAENARLREALGQYADGKNWVASYRSDLNCGYHWIGDGGGPELAQRALAGRGDGGEDVG